MNRIKSFLKASDSSKGGRHKAVSPEASAADKSPRDIPPTAPTYCAFCCGLLEGKAFRAFSKVLPASAICCDCIPRLALMNKFSSETFDYYFQKTPDYAPLKTKILKRFFAETGSIRVKKIIADLAIRMLTRSSAVLAGEKGKCRKTGMDLKPIRIALVGTNADECFALLKVACSETAMSPMLVDQKSLESGAAFGELLKTIANAENQWAELGILFCLGYAIPNARCSVIFACQTAAGLPNDVEIYNID